MKRAIIQNILVPIDFSKMSISAIKTAKRIARRFTGTIHLAHVRQFDYVGFSAPAAPLVPFSLVTSEQEEEKESQELNALAREHGVSSANCHLLSGGPAFDEICQVAREIPADSS